jgi:hypothetical protein
MLRAHRLFIVLRYTTNHKASGKQRRAETLYRVAFEGTNLTHKDVLGDGHSGMADDLLLALLRLND